MEGDKVATGETDPSEYDEVVTTKETETIYAFSSHIMHTRIGTAYTGMGLNVMTQALDAEDGSLPQSLTIQNACTELCNGSKLLPQGLGICHTISHYYSISPDPEEEDPSDKSSCSHTCARAIDTNWCNRGIRHGPRTPEAKADHETKTGEDVWGARFEWNGIQAT